MPIRSLVLGIWHSITLTLNLTGANIGLVIDLNKTTATLSSQSVFKTLTVFTQTHALKLDNEYDLLKI